MLCNEVPHVHRLALVIMWYIERNIGMILANIVNQFRWINAGNGIMRVKFYFSFNAKLFYNDGILPAGEGYEISFWWHKCLLTLNGFFYFICKLCGHLRITYFLSFLTQFFEDRETNGQFSIRVIGFFKVLNRGNAANISVWVCPNRTPHIIADA